MILNHDWKEFLSPVLLSIRISIVSSIIVFFMGMIAAWYVAKKPFKGKIIVETCFMLPLVLPPTVVGFALLLSLGRRSWIGEIMESLFKQPIVFTWWAAVIASVIVSFPLVFQTMKVGFMAIDRDLEDSGRSMGASEWQVLRYISVPLAWPAMLSAYMLGFARGLGEFGATLMIAGNIPGKTQTIPTAIYVAVDSGKMNLALYWVLSIVATSFVMLLIVNKKK
ncbi:MAG: molybdenum transporter permease [Bacilli bacterium]|jgi:molybdate transport system permease protein|nr:molybdenum transporter permease [Bacilli bacterium]